MHNIPVPHEIQQRAIDRAYVLTQEFSDRLNLEQLVRLHVVLMVEPGRLGWERCGEVMALDAHVKIGGKA